jgi:hypothetical protein
MELEKKPMNWIIAMNLFKKRDNDNQRDLKERRDCLYNLDYFTQGGIERRSGKERRMLRNERRAA